MNFQQEPLKNTFHKPSLEKPVKSLSEDQKGFADRCRMLMVPKHCFNLEMLSLDADMSEISDETTPNLVKGYNTCSSQRPNKLVSDKGHVRDFMNFRAEMKKVPDLTVSRRLFKQKVYKSAIIPNKELKKHHEYLCNSESQKVNMDFLKPKMTLKSPEGKMNSWLEERTQKDQKLASNSSKATKMTLFQSRRGRAYLQSRSVTRKVSSSKILHLLKSTPNN
ncbi:unnamed protein product [Moneuplotes crassus]|uniref:Uncharacterized protein n=1 Tax=Euplotes crassus TaxID=5936 RepID=A0AAD1Y3Z4_EUPCR|nr:unnamed protein product [Moneuplotes crassus]